MSLPDRMRRAHEQMLAMLPVTTHLAEGRIFNPGEVQPDHKQSNSPRAIKVGDRIFRSLTQAKNELHVAPTTLYNWLETGKATEINNKNPP